MDISARHLLILVIPIVQTALSSDLVRTDANCATSSDSISVQALKQHAATVEQVLNSRWGLGIKVKVTEYGSIFCDSRNIVHFGASDFIDRLSRIPGWPFTDESLGNQWRTAMTMVLCHEAGHALTTLCGLWGHYDVNQPKLVRELVADALGGFFWSQLPTSLNANDLTNSFGDQPRASDRVQQGMVSNAWYVLSDARWESESSHPHRFEREQAWGAGSNGAFDYLWHQEMRDSLGSEGAETDFNSWAHANQEAEYDELRSVFRSAPADSDRIMVPGSAEGLSPSYLHDKRLFYGDLDSIVAWADEEAYAVMFVRPGNSPPEGVGDDLELPENSRVVESLVHDIAVGNVAARIGEKLAPRGQEAIRIGEDPDLKNLCACLRTELTSSWRCTVQQKDTYRKWRVFAIARLDTLQAREAVTYLATRMIELAEATGAIVTLESGLQRRMSKDSLVWSMSVFRNRSNGERMRINFRAKRTSPFFEETTIEVIFLDFFSK